ncbi:MAG TPA: hypothetical protein VF766_07865 [Pyrinomonadaceae bacterium]
MPLSEAQPLLRRTLGEARALAGSLWNCWAVTLALRLHGAHLLHGSKEAQAARVWAKAD